MEPRRDILRVRKKKIRKRPLESSIENPLAWMESLSKKKKNNDYLIDLGIKNSFLFLSFHLLNWQFMESIVFSFSRHV